MRFSQLCDTLRIDQPSWSEFATLEVRVKLSKIDEKRRSSTSFGGFLDDFP